MPSVRGSMSTNTGSKPQCSTAAMSDTQVIVGTMTSPPGPYSLLQRGQRQQVGRRAGVDEDAVLRRRASATTPPRRLRTLAGLRQDRVVLVQQVADRVEVVALDVVLHQRPVRRPLLGELLTASERSLEFDALKSARSSGSQPVAPPRPGRGPRRRWCGRWGRTGLPAPASSGRSSGRSPVAAARRSRIPCSRSATCATISAARAAARPAVIDDAAAGRSSRTDSAMVSMSSGLSQIGSITSASMPTSSRYRARPQALDLHARDADEGDVVAACGDARLAGRHRVALFGHRALLEVQQAVLDVQHRVVVADRRRSGSPWRRTAWSARPP